MISINKRPNINKKVCSTSQNISKGRILLSQSIEKFCSEPEKTEITE
jgi:hypothetical protein